MSRAWLAALALAVAGLGGVALEKGRVDAGAPEIRRGELPRLALLTSLPLLFGEQFQLDTPRSAAMARIEREYSIVPIPLADAASLRGMSRLLMAHPRAQPAEVLVELDSWVRRGGRLALLADPLLKWESSRPLGDPLRPPPDFADTGLLYHWGLRLGSNDGGDGRLRSIGPQCRVGDNGLIARCRLGRGTAIVVADADFMMGDDDQATARLELLMAHLRRGDSR